MRDVLDADVRSVHSGTEPMREVDVRPVGQTVLKRNAQKQVAQAAVIVRNCDVVREHMLAGEHVRTPAAVAHLQIDDVAPVIIEHVLVVFAVLQIAAVDRVGAVHEPRIQQIDVVHGVDAPRRALLLKLLHAIAFIVERSANLRRPGFYFHIKWMETAEIDPLHDIVVVEVFAIAVHAENRLRQIVLRV